MSKATIAKLLLELQTELATYALNEPQLNLAQGQDVVSAILSSPHDSQWLRQRHILAVARQIAGLASINPTNYNLDLGITSILDDNKGTSIIESLERVMLNQLLKIQAMSPDEVRAYLLNGGSPTLVSQLQPQYSAPTLQEMISQTNPPTPAHSIHIKETCTKETQSIQ